MKQMSTFPSRLFSFGSALMCMDVEGGRNNRALVFHLSGITELGGASGLSSHCPSKSVSWSVVGPVCTV